MSRSQSDLLVQLVAQVDTFHPSAFFSLCLLPSQLGIDCRSFSFLSERLDLLILFSLISAGKSQTSIEMNRNIYGRKREEKKKK
mmetsp:Transcript_14375/g.28929  ORF Transcript_14375/g.28929 Transcript_14375/m.28929 type:complete len:84 (-) Transcript_14375:63-314(-)